jgi:hypothetical protein
MDGHALLTHALALANSPAALLQARSVARSACCRRWSSMSNDLTSAVAACQAERHPRPACGSRAIVLLPECGIELQHELW